MSPITCHASVVHYYQIQIADEKQFGRPGDGLISNAAVFFYYLFQSQEWHVAESAARDQLTGEICQLRGLVDALTAVSMTNDINGVPCHRYCSFKEQLTRTFAVRRSDSF